MLDRTNAFLVEWRGMLERAEEKYSCMFHYVEGELIEHYGYDGIIYELRRSV